MTDNRARVFGILVALILLVVGPWAPTPSLAATSPCCVVVSQKTQNKTDWNAVIEALVRRRGLLGLFR